MNRLILFDVLRPGRNILLLDSRLILVIVLSLTGPLSVKVEAQSNSSKIKIPFELTRGRMYVQTFVNEQGPFRFLVDTGASGIGRADTSLVKDLGLRLAGTTQNFDGVSSSTVDTVTIASLRIGPLTQRNVQLISRNYNAGRSPESKIINGIIGDAFFANYLLTLDYKKQEIVLSKGALQASDAGVVRYDDSFVVPLRIGEFEAVGAFDTGSTLEMHLPIEWAKRLKIETLRDAGEGRRANTIFKLFSAELPVAVNIGGNKINRTAAHFSELAPNINIGGLFLANNRCVITFDQKNRLIKIRCSEK